MACKCGYENSGIPSGREGLFRRLSTAAPPAFTPEVLMCLECGLTEFKFLMAERIEAFDGLRVDFSLGRFRRLAEARLTWSKRS